MLLKAHEIHNKHGLQRSHHWNSFRHHLILERGSKCELSGLTTELEAHHIIPFHFGILLDRPYIELDPRNIIVLSNDSVRNYHLLLGHLGSFQSYNPHVRDMLKFAHLDTKQIKVNPEWIKLRENRPKVWEKMNGKDKSNLLKLINKLYPH